MRSSRAKSKNCRLCPDHPFRPLFLSLPVFLSIRLVTLAISIPSSFPIFPPPSCYPLPPLAFFYLTVILFTVAGLRDGGRRGPMRYYCPFPSSPFSSRSVTAFAAGQRSATISAFASCFSLLVSFPRHGTYFSLLPSLLSISRLIFFASLPSWPGRILFSSYPFLLSSFILFCFPLLSRCTSRARLVDEVMPVVANLTSAGSSG